MAGQGTYTVDLGFIPASQAVPDEERPPLLRARPRAATPYGEEGIEVRACEATDWSQAEVDLDLFTLGFDEVDLTADRDLQAVLASVRSAGRISDEDGAAIRSALDGARLRCSSGRELQVLHVADEGLIMRTGGPNGLSLTGPTTRGMNGHGPATSVHSDQDVFGTPLTQLMDGRAPELFRHESPDGSNRHASLMLLNLWIPLQQITRPLVLADGRTVDRRSHQLRFGLATDSFLDRGEDQKVNDIWTFLHHPDQRWYFSSDLDHTRALVFDTLSTPHTAAVLSGEDAAERCYLALEAAEAAAERGDVAEVRRAASEARGATAPSAPPALRRAVDEMASLLEQAADDPAAMVSGTQEWVARSRAARRRVVRMSIELRMVASVGSPRVEG
jgi:hypothetical protein